jgi:diguanylate cyclase (GGDEF)-like protein/PAS domain S-box-containing protein
MNRLDDTNDADERDSPDVPYSAGRLKYVTRARQSPLRLFLSLLALLFCVGVAVMLLADFLFLSRTPAWVDALVNAGLMTAIGSVIVWHLFMRPLRVAYIGEATRARAVLDAAVEGIVTINERGIVESFNPAAEQMFHYAAREVVGRNVSMLMPEPHAAEHDAYLQRYVTTGHARLVGTRELLAVRKDGSQFSIEISLTEIQIGKKRNFTGFIRDITERKQAEEHVRHLAHFDGLTDIPNRMFFYDRLEQAINLARRDKHKVALLYLDLDKFKEVNDSLGHDAGDELLKNVARRIRRLLRESDTVARVGGDEFAVILPQIETRDAAAEVVKKVIAALARPYDLAGHGQDVLIGSSVGISVFPEDGADAGTLVKAADSAMYHAKQEGNTFRFCKA